MFSGVEVLQIVEILVRRLYRNLSKCLPLGEIEQSFIKVRLHNVTKKPSRVILTLYTVFV